MHVFRASMQRCQLHAKCLSVSNMYSYVVGDRVTFPLNNLESVPVRDFLLRSLICSILAYQVLVSLGIYFHFISF